VVQELKKRAGAHGRRVEAEHRAILAELMAAMPDVGSDSDFQRVEEPLDACDVFD
jgi:plasmid stability protein